MTHQLFAFFSVTPPQEDLVKLNRSANSISTIFTLIKLFLICRTAKSNQSTEKAELEVCTLVSSITCWVTRVTKLLTQVVQRWVRSVFSLPKVVYSSSLSSMYEQTISRMSLYFIGDVLYCPLRQPPRERSPFSLNFSIEK